LGVGEKSRFVGNNQYTAEGFRLGGRSRLDGGRLSRHAASRPPPNPLAAMVAPRRRDRFDDSGIQD
jgi:hypothetical protein